MVREVQTKRLVSSPNQCILSAWSPPSSRCLQDWRCVWVLSIFMLNYNNNGQINMCKACVRFRIIFLLCVCTTVSGAEVFYGQSQETLQLPESTAVAAFQSPTHSSQSWNKYSDRAVLWLMNKQQPTWLCIIFYLSIYLNMNKDLQK